MKRRKIMSASPQISPERKAPTEPGERSATAVLKFMGMAIPLPQWAVSIVAVFVIVFLPVFLFVSVRHMQADVNKENVEINNERALSQAKAEEAAAKKALADAQKELQGTMAKMAEAQDNYIEDTKHRGEAGEEYHRDKKIVVTHYASDGCISVLRAGDGAPKWNKEPAGNGAPSASPGPVDGGVTSGNLAPRPQPVAKLQGKAARSGLDASSGVKLTLVDFKGSLAEPAPQADSVTPEHASLNGRCLNPHPGKFTSSNGKVQGCWTQLWRKWPDGCTHYQWFNACSSTWDVDSSGRARVYWTACRH
jgi:hypothetical protein